MAKAGFDYISEETDHFQDLKIKKLKRRYKGNGYAVWKYINSQIFRDKGYFVTFDEECILDVAEYWGLDEVEVIEIVTYCLQINLYSGAIFDKFNILTSAGIQRRFLKWSDLAKRKNAKVPEKHRCEDDGEIKLPEEMAKVPEEIEIIPEKIDVKESKVKESKEPVKYVRDDFFEIGILKFFGFSEMPFHNQQQKILYECCRANFFRNELDFFKKQCEDYQKYIEAIGPQFKKNFFDFLGQQSECFQDGFWRSENWEQKLIDRQRQSGNGRGGTAVIESSLIPVQRIKK